MYRPDTIMLALYATLAATPVYAEDFTRLKRMVIQDCGSCHGLTMRGGLGRPLTPQALQHFDEASIACIILDGVPGTAMPKWRPLLTQDQALWIAHYLKSRTP